VAEGARCCVSRAVLTGGDPRTPDKDYFGACVLPLAATKPEYQHAANEYAANCGLRAAQERFCECGKPMPKGKRKCENCRTRARRMSYRAEKARQRVLQKLPFSPSQGVAS